jgi:hypothetical protein
MSVVGTELGFKELECFFVELERRLVRPAVR